MLGQLIHIHLTGPCSDCKIEGQKSFLELLESMINIWAKIAL